jgi:hypothetical protein
MQYFLYFFKDGGRYDNSYVGGGQRPYYENNRGRGGSNSNYRGKK